MCWGHTRTSHGVRSNNNNKQSRLPQRVLISCLCFCVTLRDDPWRCRTPSKRATTERCFEAVAAVDRHGPRREDALTRSEDCRERREERDELRHGPDDSSPLPPPPRAAVAEYFPMTPEAGGRLAARGRPTPLVEVRPQGKVEWHSGIGYELVLALDAPMLPDGGPVWGRPPVHSHACCCRAGYRRAQDHARGSHPAAHCRNWWKSWWKCQHIMFSSSRPLTFQFLMVVGVSVSSWWRPSRSPPRTESNFRFASP